jgi:large subunit ribosomal protein L23
MALLNFFKKKKKAEEKKEIKKVAKKEVKEAPPAKKKPVKAAAKPKKTPEIAYRVLKRPQVTEKATDLTKQNQYVFRVFSDANKKDIKKTIEDLYGVDVVKVQVIQVPPKQRRLGRTEGWRKAYKKAVVRIKEGQKIELLPR